LKGIGVSRIGWLRAAVLGANDGIVSTASLIVGVAAASGVGSAVLVAGVAGLVAGAMSMAAGEYVSVSSQSDTEQSDLARERAELTNQPALERAELAEIYAKRGVESDLAYKVADQLMAKDALGAHARDELGISEMTTARPKYGVPAAPYVVVEAASQWTEEGRTPFSVGDLSRPDLSPWDDHSKRGDHTKGTGIDIRPIRTDGKNASVTYRDPAYDREATQRLVDTFRATGGVEQIFFNDPEIKGVTRDPKGVHDNHLHVRVNSNYRRPPRG